MKKLTKWMVVFLMSMFLVQSIFAQGPARRKQIRKWKIKKRVEAMRYRPAPELGFRYGYATNVEKSYAGAQLWLPMARRFYFVSAFDYLYGWQGTQYKGNLNLILIPAPRSQFYFGGGLVLHYKKISGNTGEMNFGGNVLLGIKLFPRSPIHPFIQPQWTFINHSQNHFSVLVGLNLRIR
jgi:hypothetical protein